MVDSSVDQGKRAVKAAASFSDGKSMCFVAPGHVKALVQCTRIAQVLDILGGEPEVATVWAEWNGGWEGVKTMKEFDQLRL